MKIQTISGIVKLTSVKFKGPTIKIVRQYRLRPRLITKQRSLPQVRTEIRTEH